MNKLINLLLNIVLQQIIALKETFLLFLDIVIISVGINDIAAQTIYNVVLCFSFSPLCEEQASRRLNLIEKR